MGYPGALGLDLTEEAGDFDKILKKVESAIVEKGGAGPVSYTHLTLPTISRV